VKKPGWMFALIALLSIQTLAQTPAPLESKIDKIFASLNSNDTPGGAVLVIKNGTCVLAHGYGVSDLRTRHKIDNHTNFRLASVTKQFTAMAVMLLVHDGKLHYEDRLTQFFADFPAYGKSITIRNLLNHTSGLIDYEDVMAARYGSTPDDQIPQIKDAGVVELMKQQSRTKFAPGTKWDYSNGGYATLAMIVEQISGKSFGQFLHDRIFAPLEMDHTLAFEKGKNDVPNRAYGYTRKDDSWQETDQSSTSAVLGDGGVYSSLDDLAKWDLALREHKLLSAEGMLPALAPVEPPLGLPYGPDGTPASYGFGWFLDPYRGHARMWHYGETVGFRTSIQRFTDDGITIIVLCNRADASAINLALRVADLYLTGK
jgi:CubicO group peptidase (beta-lactamase class C family)